MTTTAQFAGDAHEYCEGFPVEHGAIILCGGKSSRMGRDKATLPFGPELMLQRVVRLLCEVVNASKIVVVAATDQQLPTLAEGVSITRDRQGGRGPLEGLNAGMEFLRDRVDVAYATSCDVPLLVPEFVRTMFDRIQGFEIAVPCEGENYHPLAAVYRPSVLNHIQRLLDANRLRPRFLFDAAKTNVVDVNDLKQADPDLQTLTNLNYPDDYQDALRVAGFSVEANLFEK